eukprot:5050779-Prorocentrum_lima.AAC.1
MGIFQTELAGILGVHVDEICHWGMPTQVDTRPLNQVLRTIHKQPPLPSQGLLLAASRLATLGHDVRLLCQHACVEKRRRLQASMRRAMRFSCDWRVVGSFSPTTLQTIVSFYNGVVWEVGYGLGCMSKLPQVEGLIWSAEALFRAFSRRQLDVEAVASKRRWHSI